MDFQTLYKIVNELSRLSHAAVDRVYEDAGKNIILVLRKDGENMFLLISPDRSLPRLHLIQKKPPAAAASHPFTLYLKSRATGSRIIDISLLNRDRIAAVRFLRQGAEHVLIFEIIGRNANLILCDASRSILSVYHPVFPSESSMRFLLAGAVYQFPPGAAACRALEEISHPAGMRANIDAERDFDAIIKQRKFSAERARLASVLRRASGKAERLRQNLIQDRVQAENAESFRIAGELIVANLRLLKTGMDRVDLTGYDGTRHAITLDPVRSPKGNADLFFKKYKKAKAGRTIIERRLRETESEIMILHSQMKDLETALDDRDLSAVRSCLEKKSIVRPAPAGKLTKFVSDKEPVRKFFTGGWEIIVGKSAAGNDYLTTKLAGPDDLWLHAEGLPGSHVVIRNPEKKKISGDVLLKAASLAAYYSKGRTAGKVSVTYTPARNVKKPKGAKPGLVILLERKSILVAPAQDGLLHE